MTAELQAERAAFLTQFPVSHETIHRLDLYAKELVVWNERFNLVAKSTLPYLWTRHFLDSAQLFPLLPQDRPFVLADIGSGAGFPGLVLAILGREYSPSSTFHLIESIGKKANFLRHIASECGLSVTVHADRAEALPPLNADVVTARAVSALTTLLGYAHPLLKHEGYTLFLKGAKTDEELAEAQKQWTFAAEKRISITDPSGSVVTLHGLKLRHRAPRRRP